MAEELQQQIQGVMTEMRLGTHTTRPMNNERGVPPGAVQRLQAGNMHALPQIAMANTIDTKSVTPRRFSPDGWVMCLQPLSTASMGQQGIFVDEVIHTYATNKIDMPEDKVQYYSRDPRNHYDCQRKT